MIEHRIFSYQESRICVFRNNFTSDQLLKEFDTNVYATEYQNLQSENRKKEFLGLRLALKYCCNGEEKSILHTPTGKPILEDGSYKISFSHCKDWIASMIHPSAEVGVDIELPTDKLRIVAKRFLGKKEQIDFNASNSLDYLRIAWSAKEALYKIIGKEAYNFSEKLRVLPFPICPKGELQVLYTDTAKIFIIHYILTEPFTLAYCIDNE